MPISKAMTKTTFGIPSMQTASMIDDNDATNAACAAHFRFQARIRELEMQFEAKAGELRASFLTELDGIRCP